MREIVKAYQCVTEDSETQLEKSVMAMIAEGWEPLGGVSVTASTYENQRKGYMETSYTYAQAMVKYGPKLKF